VASEADAGATRPHGPDAAEQALLAQAWELAYLDPLAARDIGQRLTAEGATPAAQAEGWLHVALAEVRIGAADLAAQAVERAAAGYEALPDPAQRARGRSLCDQVRAIDLRRRGEYGEAAALLEAIGARGGFEPDPMHDFLYANSCAITHKLLGHTDTALRHFYAASDAARRTGWAGPVITALTNLGGYQHDLYNLDDARRLTGEALAAARAAGAQHAAIISAVNLIVIHYAAGDLQRSREMAGFVIEHRDEWPPATLWRYGPGLALGHLAGGDTDAAMGFLEAGPAGAVADGDGITAWAWVMARCLLARQQPQAAREVAERTLEQRRSMRLSDQVYDTMELLKALADACEACGDATAALAHLRQAHARYEQLVGRSARARYVAMEVSHELAQAQAERDRAVRERDTVEHDHRRLAELNAALQAQIRETERLHAKLTEQALRDPLTGLHNRRYLFEMAPGLLELARRQGTPLCVVLMDLDHFKLLNDTFGHAAGDVVLQRFATLLTQTLRKSDVVVRHGGEEFVAVMPDIEGAAAQAVLTRLLDAFHGQQIELGRRRLPRGSFSAGIATFPRHGHTLEQLLSRADRLLYAAKNQGRARIELAPATGFSTFG
jgi:diguanylate cyclase (GGDEF)-like protein